MNRVSSTAAFALISLLVAGCASNRPLITEDKLGRSGVRTVATSAESRLVMVKSNEPDLRWWRIWGHTNAFPIEARICAEPPPDVAQRIFEKLDLTTKVSGSNGSVSANAEVELARQVARDIAQLTKRSQGVILFRDFSFRLSEAYFNGAIDANQLQSALSNAFVVASETIKFELQKNPTLSNTSNQSDLAELLSADAKDLKSEITTYHKNAKVDMAAKIETVIKEQTGKEWVDFVNAEDICSDKLRVALAKIHELK